MNPENPVKIGSYSFRNFIRRLNNAAVSRKHRENQLEEIGDRMKTLSKLSTEKKPSKKKIDKEFEGLKIKIEEVVAKDRITVIKQRDESNEIDELRRKIEQLEEKMHSLSHVHSFISDKHSERLSELQSALREVGYQKQEIKRLPQEEINKFVLEKVKPLKEYGKEKVEVKAEKPKKLHPMIIKSLKKKISVAEKLHTKLKKKGHPKEDLQRLKKVIDSHKKKLGKLK